MKQTLFLMLGYPGAGKTTVARLISEATGAAHIWADFERRQRFEHPTHSPEENTHLYAALNAEADTLLREGKHVVYDTNFNYKHDRIRMKALAEKHGAQTVVIWITTKRDLAERRATLESEGQHIRQFGNMSTDVFHRLSGNLQAPDADETVLQLDGAHVDARHVAALLAQIS